MLNLKIPKITAFNNVRRKLFNKAVKRTGQILINDQKKISVYRNRIQSLDDIFMELWWSRFGIWVLLFLSGLSRSLSN